MEEKNDGEGEGEYIRVHFRVRCPIRLGQSLAISGSSFSLGNYTTKRRKLNLLPRYHVLQAILTHRKCLNYTPHQKRIQFGLRT